jgi:aspartate kinase
VSIIVQKYGGSSVADVTKLGLVAEKVVAARRAGHDVVVVVSAMGKTTDELLALARTVAGAGPNGAIDPPRRELDMLLSTGERVSMALLSIAIHARGAEAISFTGSQSGIITNDRHFDARIIEVRPHRIEDELARGKIVIIAGYQGMSYRREITTLGRGGSDTTAVALAAALGAERCEIYSDVDGVYSADPRVVANPVHLPTIDLATLQEMAEAGAKVLNAQAVEWARKSKIAIYARKTSDPTPEAGAAPRQTIAAEDSVARVRAVVGLANVVRLRTSVSATRFGAAAAACELPIVDLSGDESSARALLPLLNVPDWERRRTELGTRCEKLECSAGHALVSVVGAELAGAVPQFLAALAKADAPAADLTAGALRISAAIPDSRLAAAQQALHAAFVDGR